MLRFHVHAQGLDAVREKLREGCREAEHTLAAQIRKDTSPYVPFLNGSLDERTRVDGGAVIYPGPYARFLYYGKLMIDPSTGSSYAPKGGTKVVTNQDLHISRASHPKAQAFWFEASKAENLEKWIRVSEKEVKRER